MSVAVIVAAGGQGRRLGGAVPKQFLDLGRCTVLDLSIGAFVSHPDVDEIVVVQPAGSPPVPSWLHSSKPIRIATGGERRQDSVAAGFSVLGSHVDLVVVHDAARPFVDAETISRVIAGARRSGAAIAALPASDTVKEADGLTGHVRRTLPRETIWLAQTPQAFARHVMADAVRLGQTGIAGTDEAALAEQAGHAVALVEGDVRNVKITTAADLQSARARLAALAADGLTVLRTGLGYDSHRLVDGRPLRLGGVDIPSARGPDAHSDGDALCHAITDAVLGAAALGDIGRHFPDTDEAWRGADSLALLRHAVKVVHDAGFVVVNVDAVVIAERPALAPHVDRIRVTLADALGIDPASVSVKGKTNEGLGEIGRGEAIAVHAVATLRSGQDARPLRA